MDEIRALRRADLPEVASLIELAFLSGSRTPARALAPFLERILLDHPWVDPNIPSLVAVDDRDRIVGFLGSHIRRFRFDGRPIRMAVSGQLVVEPDARERAVGAYLLKRYLQGPQEITVTDTASETIRRLWERLGGDTIHLGRIGWLRVFRPITFAGGFLLRENQSVRRLAIAVTAPLDAIVEALVPKQLIPPAHRLRAEPLTPTDLASTFGSLVADTRVHPDYDLEFLTWLLTEVTAVRARGTCVARLIRRADGHVLGWYIYFLSPRGVSQVVQIASRARDVPEILDHLLRHAYVHGSAAVQGRVEPPLVEPLSVRHCALHASGYRMLAHSLDRELLYALHAGDCVLSRLEGDWWMGIGMQALADRAGEP